MHLSYRCATVMIVAVRKKRSISMPPELDAEIAEAAAHAGMSYSAWLAEMARMEAPGFLRNSNPARQVLNVPFRSISTTALKPFADIPVTGAGKLPAAAQSRISIAPSRSLTFPSAASRAG